MFSSLIRHVVSCMIRRHIQVSCGWVGEGRGGEGRGGRGKQIERTEYFQCSDVLTLSWLSIAPLGLPDVPDWK